MVRNPVVSYTESIGGQPQQQLRVPYFLVEYDKISDAVSAPRSPAVELRAGSINTDRCVRWGLRSNISKGH